MPAQHNSHQHQSHNQCITMQCAPGRSSSQRQHPGADQPGDVTPNCCTRACKGPALTAHGGIGNTAAQRSHHGPSWGHLVALVILVATSNLSCIDAANPTTSSPVQAPSNSETYVFTGVIGALGFVLLVCVTVLVVRITSMWRKLQQSSASGLGRHQQQQQLQLRSTSRQSRRSASGADQGPSAQPAIATATDSGLGGSIVSRSTSMPAPNAADLQKLSALSAKSSSTWKPTGNGGQALSSGMGTSSYSGGSGQSSGQSLPSAVPLPWARHQANTLGAGGSGNNMAARQSSHPALLRLAQTMGRGGGSGGGGGHQMWQLQQAAGVASSSHSASAAALPMLSTLAGPTVIHSDPTHSGSASACNTLDRSPFFTPQSPGTLSKVELRSPSAAAAGGVVDHPIAMQSLKFGAEDIPGQTTTTTTLASPLQQQAAALGNQYENDILRMNAERRQLTLNLSKPGPSSSTPGLAAASGGAKARKLSTGASSAGSVPSTQYLPMDGALLSPVTQPMSAAVSVSAASDTTAGSAATAVAASANTASQGSGVAGGSSAGDLLTPMDAPRGVPMHEAQASIAKSLRDQYASYEDMSHPQHARQSSSSSSRSKKHSSGGTPKSPRSKPSLTHRLGAHFSKSSGLKFVLHGRRQNSSKDLKSDSVAAPADAGAGAVVATAIAKPRLPSPTALQPGSLVTPVDHLREASVASTLSAASMPLPDQQRYVPFPMGHSPHSLSHALHMQMEASSQELSPAQSKALEL
ncbi:mucin-19-like isoform X3 [Sycon ciliatum]|uniref:mucin-19-like isoform X3 n=1 Tax=Sycon ciliatum TaxID=27933 RepID=UPI0031F6D3B9